MIALTEVKRIFRWVNQLVTAALPRCQSPRGVQVRMVPREGPWGSPRTLGRLLELKKLVCPGLRWNWSPWTLRPDDELMESNLNVNFPKNHDDPIISHVEKHQKMMVRYGSTRYRHVPKFLSQRQVPAFEATKKFYQRVAALEEPSPNFFRDLWCWRNHVTKNGSKKKRPFKLNKASSSDFLATFHVLQQAFRRPPTMRQKRPPSRSIRCCWRVGHGTTVESQWLFNQRALDFIFFSTKTDFRWVLRLTVWFSSPKTDSIDG